MFKETKDIKKFEHFYKNRWDIQNLTAAPAFVYACQVSGILTMKKGLGYGYDRFIMEFKNDNVEIYYNRESMHKCRDIYMEKYQKNKKYNKKIWNISEKQFKILNTYFKKNLHKLNEVESDKLLQEYHKFFLIFCDLFKASHIVECIALTTDVKLKNDILRELEKVGKQNKFNEIFELLTQPNMIPFVAEANNEISFILGDVYKDKNLLKLFQNNKITIEDLKIYNKTYKKIKKYVANYYWINTSWFGGKEMNLDDFILELKGYIENNEKIKFVSKNKLKEDVSKRKKIIKEIKMPKELTDLVDITSFMAYLQDVRKEYILKGVLMLQKFAEEISTRIGIDVDDFKYLLTNELGLIKKKSRGDLERFLRKRRAHFGMLHEGKDMMFLDAKNCQKFFGRMDKTKELKEIKEINGISASAGRVIGRVKNCLNFKECEKIKKGDILVTSMTRPEFIQAMKKAAAVVTDEGGITCHAAIVSRELGIPCVIGTKVATKLLKDGDEVEVNANHGVVKILK